MIRQPVHGAITWGLAAALVYAIVALGIWFGAR